MLSWFTESAIVPLIFGSLIGLAFLGLAVSFRDRVMLYVAIAIAVFTAGTVITEQLIVTDREAVTEVVYSIADQVRLNDVDGVLKFVSDRREDTQKSIRAEMPRYRFNSVRITGVVDFQVETGKPKTAKIDFGVWAGGTSGRYGQFTVRRRAILTLQKEEDGQWRVIDYEHFEPASTVSL
jgi:hypothetical protein